MDPQHRTTARPFSRPDPRVSEGGGSRPHPSFAVHDEGGGLLALYLSPCPVDIIADALEDLGRDEVYGAGRVRMPTVLAGALSGAFELTSGPCRYSVMAAPDEAVPDASAFAASTYGDDHAVVYARDPKIVEAVLRRWLAAHLADVGIGFGLDGVGDAAIRRLAAPVPHTSWQEPRLRRRAPGSTLCTLEFRTEGSGDPEPAIDPTRGEVIRWIGGQRYGWRTDWAW